MRFIFDCEDEICLPIAYNLVNDIKEFVSKIDEKDVENADGKKASDRMKKIIENMMVKYPKDTGELLAKLWVLDNGEKAPNSFKTMSALFTNEVAIDFFTSVMPSLLQISRSISPLLK